MSEALEPKFSCAACGRAFRWNPQIAGKRAKCKCGQTVQVPASPPAPPAPARAASSAESPPPPPAAAAAACPSCGAAMAPGAVLCVACGYNLKTGQRLGAPAVTREPDEAAALPPVPAGSAAPGGPAGAYAGTFRRAKIDEATTAEEQGASWKGYVSILVGLIFVGLAVWQVVDPTDFSTMSSSGGRRGRAFKALLRWVYSLGGTWAVVGVFALIALLFILGGLATVMPPKKAREEAAG